MKECGECKACCQGYVIGEAYGVPFGPNRPCAFLTGGCSIYQMRPTVCRKYFCAWVQGLFPDWMRPDKSRAIISVQNWSKGQFLLVSEMGEKLSDEVLLEVNKFSKENNCPTIIQYEGKMNLNGPPEFLEEKKNYQNILPQIL
jgi:hypothetical protein